MQRLGNTTTLVIRLDKTVKERLQQVVEDRDMSRVVRELIDAYLRDNDGRKYRTKTRRRIPGAD